jgi:hypothetical protein
MVTSSWLYGRYPRNAEDGLSIEQPAAERAKIAEQDWRDLRGSDVCISFTELARSNGRGGRHVEFGLALAFGIQCIVVGPREHVFHCLPSVRHYPDWDSLVADFTGHGSAHHAATAS